MSLHSARRPYSRFFGLTQKIAVRQNSDFWVNPIYYWTLVFPFSLFSFAWTSINGINYVLSLKAGVHVNLSEILRSLKEWLKEKVLEHHQTVERPWKGIPGWWATVSVYVYRSPDVYQYLTSSSNFKINNVKSSKFSISINFTYRLRKTISQIYQIYPKMTQKIIKHQKRSMSIEILDSLVT